MSLEGRTAIVTGAGRGIGRSIAERLAGDGARVMLAARGEDALVESADRIAQAGGEAAVCVTDITDEVALERLLGETQRRLGAPSVLVCNSGIAGPSAPLWEISREEWEETFEVNVTGTYLCCKVAIPHLLRGDGASIVVVGSMTGKRPLVNRTPYASSKSALIGMVRTLAHELGPHGVRVNLVSPGPVEGPRIRWVIERQAAAKGVSFEEAERGLVEQSALGRLVPPDHVSGAVSYLASDAAASVTGEDLNVSAGMVMYG